MLKLLYCSNAYSTHDYRFLKAFLAGGWSVDWFPLSVQRLDDRDVPTGVRRVGGGSGAWPPASPEACVPLLRMAREVVGISAPDLVVAGPIQSGAWVMARAGARPLVAMSWGSDLLVDARSSAQLERVTRYTLGQAAGLLGDCRAVREAARSFAPFDDNQVCLIPWGLEHPMKWAERTNRQTLRQRLGWMDCTILLSVRSWEPVYGIEVLVRAFARVSRTRPELKLLLLGDGSLATRIHGLIHEEGLESRIYAPGRVAQAELSPYYQAADLYVSSALSDGTSVSLLEAMAHRLPVLAAGAHGNLEWIEPGRSGWLHQPGDVTSLAAALHEALNQTAKFESMGAWNQRVVATRADWDKNASGMLDFLQRMAQQRARLNAV
jgi:glycosyltransferase involved in cell wall biosynthesis